jgi:hypothetical protein
MPFLGESVFGLEIQSWLCGKTLTLGKTDERYIEILFSL